MILTPYSVCGELIGTLKFIFTNKKNKSIIVIMTITRIMIVMMRLITTMIMVLYDRYEERLLMSYVIFNKITFLY